MDYYIDYFNSKAFATEFVLTGICLYKWPTATFSVLGLICASYLACYLLKKKPSSVNTTNMPAILYHPRSFIVLNHIEIPRYGKNQVLVQVKAAAINPVDFKLKTSDIPFIRWLLPHTVGRDFSGTIIELGANVKNFKVGDHVYGNAKGGSLQQYTVALHNEISLKPSNLSFTEAAAIPLAGATSLQALQHFGDLKNKKVLIIGASGGTGSLGVQIAKYYNATVYAVCGGNNAEYVKSLGADVVVDYSRPQYLDDVQNEQFDLIYDTVTSPEDANQETIFRKFLKNEGKYVAINGKITDFIRGFIGYDRRNYHLHLLKWNTKDLETLKTMCEENKLNARIQVMPFEKKNVLFGFDSLKSRRTVGKIVYEL